MYIVERGGEKMYEFRAAVDVRVILNNHKGQTIS